MLVKKGFFDMKENKLSRKKNYLSHQWTEKIIYINKMIKIMLKKIMLRKLSIFHYVSFLILSICLTLKC